MPIMDMLPKGDTLQIPLDAPTSLAATAGNAQVELTWTDPANKYATPEGEVSETGDQLVSEWSHTVLVRKTGSQPAGPDDGTVVVSSSVRNQYQTTPYTDSGLTNDTEYFYGVFAYNKDGVASAGAFVSATPKAGTPLSELTEGTIIKINENGSPVEFYLAKHNYEPGLNGEGRELVVRKDVYRPKGVWNSTDENEYSDSTIDALLNGTYKAMFSPSVQSLMGTTKFYYTPGGGTQSSPSQVSTLERAVFEPSLAELGLSYSAFNQEGSALPIASMLISLPVEMPAASQWTRSVHTMNASVASADYPGGVSPRSATYDCYYRPSFSLRGAFVNDDLELIE